jgi:tetratricopeptide (TPR) repeat protein
LTPEEIALHLQEAGKLIDAGSCAAALLEHLDVVLASQPAQEEALKLKARAEACPPPVTTSPVGELARYIPPEKGGLPTLPGEIQRDYTARIQAMKKRYDEAVGFFSSGAYARADQAFTGIVRDASDRYLEAGKLLLQSKENLRQSALKVYADARELESRSEFDKAIQELRRAHEISADVVVDLDVERVVGKKTALGEKRCAEGRANYAVRQNAVALQAYEEAVRLLPPEHKCVAEAKERIAALKK